MKNDKNIITEKYYGPIVGSWSRVEFNNAIKNKILKRFLKQDLRKFFDGFFVPAEWFSFKNFFKMDSGSFEITNSGSPTNCNIEFSCTRELSPAEATMLIYGNPKEKKYGGLMYNPNFADKLMILPMFGGAEPKEEKEKLTQQQKPKKKQNDDEWEEVNDEQETANESSFENILNAYKLIYEASTPVQRVTQPLTLTIEFKFDKISYVEKEEGVRFRARDYLNPNYITSLHADIYFKFNDVVETKCHVGDVTFMPQRTANMDPPKRPSFRENLKNLWTDTMSGDRPTDFGVAGVLAKQTFKRMLGGVAREGDITVVQYEEVKINLNQNFSYQQAFKMEEDREEAEIEAAEKGGSGAESIKEKILRDITYNDSKLLLEINDSKRNMKISVKYGGAVLLILNVEPKLNAK